MSDIENLLHKTRNQCYKLRRERLAITRAYEDVCRKLDIATEALYNISSADTSQDASPKQCGLVFIAMNALEKLK